MSDLDYLNAFSRIPASGPQAVDTRDLAAYWARKDAVRRGSGTIKVTVEQLQRIAQRIHEQSEEIARLTGADEDFTDQPLPPMSGVLILDTEADAAALYSDNGVLIYSADTTTVRERIDGNAWIVHEILADGFIRFHGHWPSHRHDFAGALGTMLRAKRAAEIERGRSRA
jgi:hypothetical protein